MKTSAIISVYNEESTIESVIVSTYLESVDEIIVINDGSTDNTEFLIKNMKNDIKIKDIHFKKNKGKGHAMAVGIENASNEIIVFVDADQTKITPGYIARIIDPVVMDNYDMVLGYSTVNILNKDVNPLKILTGERVLYKKDVLPILNKIRESRFGVETLLYLYYTSTEKRIKYTHLVGLKHKDKYKKVSLIKATIDYLEEAWEIANTTIKNFDLAYKSASRIILKS